MLLFQKKRKPNLLFQNYNKKTNLSFLKQKSRHPCFFYISPLFCHTGNTFPHLRHTLPDRASRDPLKSLLFTLTVIPERQSLIRYPPPLSHSRVIPEFCPAKYPVSTSSNSTTPPPYRKVYLSHYPQSNKKRQAIACLLGY